MPVLTVEELIKELVSFPRDLEVMLDVRGEEAFAKGVSLDTGGASSWVTINDYRDDRNQKTQEDSYFSDGIA